ncbi:hypothetical protein [Pararhodospirillum oryzae]|uniref:Uncharacterized protein n=1 Tax=Pararhodospirillum oryzae TaxID=478448 RepID=A0A512HAU7_9PROT|nr:hypothetical protein [Pararhodospirillum oryzae]GEO82510.1 hypothetical protein ROR02_26410 [Pararhodospirillum oryzae]
MTESLKKNRGRPKGSGKDDSQALSKVADLLAAEDKMKPTTAMKRAGVKNPSDLRRLQVKWRDEGAVHLQAAKQRLEQKRNAARGGHSAGGFHGYDPTTGLPYGLLSAPPHNLIEHLRISPLARLNTPIGRIALGPERQALEEHTRRMDEMLPPFDSIQEIIKQTLDKKNSPRKKRGETGYNFPPVGRSSLGPEWQALEEHTRRIDEMLRPFDSIQEIIKRTLDRTISLRKTK